MFPSPTTLSARRPPRSGTPHTLLLHRPLPLPQPCRVAQQRWEPGQVHRGLQHVAGGPRLWGHDGHWLPAWGGEGGESVETREPLSQLQSPAGRRELSPSGPSPHLNSSGRALPTPTH